MLLKVTECNLLCLLIFFIVLFRLNITTIKISFPFTVYNEFIDLNACCIEAEKTIKK
jgi:hypothetical protein